MFQEKYFFGQVKLSNTVQIISLLYSAIQEWVTSPGVKKTLELHLAQVLKMLTSSRESFHHEMILLWKEMKVRCNSVQEISFKISSPHLDTLRVVSSQRQLTVQRPGLSCYHHFPEVSLILHFTGWGVLAIELLVSNPQERPQTQAPSGWGGQQTFSTNNQKISVFSFVNCHAFSTLPLWWSSHRHKGACLCSNKILFTQTDEGPDLSCDLQLDKPDLGWRNRSLLRLPLFQPQNGLCSICCPRSERWMLTCDS